jgi:hypothetical protein
VVLLCLPTVDSGWVLPSSSSQAASRSNRRMPRRSTSIRRSRSTLVHISIQIPTNRKTKLTRPLIPDLRLVHLHLPPVDPHYPLDAGFQLAILYGLDHFYLSRSRVPRCPQHCRWTPTSRADCSGRRVRHRRCFHRVVQYAGWSRGSFEFFLCPSCGALPVE